MHKYILSQLQKIEVQHQFNILFACESGSRAWGFASKDSDYDVRFIYAPHWEWYLSLENKKDSLETFLPKDLDLAGWELSKTLKLFSSCNLALNEWLGSPEIYRMDQNFHKRLSQLIPNYFNPKRAVFHYLNMAKKNWETLSQASFIKLKKLFYVIRPILACEWIQKKKSMPPTLFNDLIKENFFDPEIEAILFPLWEKKLLSSEQDSTIIDSKLKQWIEQSIINHEKMAEQLATGTQVSWDPLNAIMKKWITPLAS